MVPQHPALTSVPGTPFLPAACSAVHGPEAFTVPQLIPCGLLGLTAPRACEHSGGVFGIVCLMALRTCFSAWLLIAVPVIPFPFHQSTLSNPVYLQKDGFRRLSFFLAFLCFDAVLHDLPDFHCARSQFLLQKGFGDAGLFFSADLTVGGDRWLIACDPKWS